MAVGHSLHAARLKDHFGALDGTPVGQLRHPREHVLAVGEDIQPQLRHLDPENAGEVGVGLFAVGLILPGLVDGPALRRDQHDHVADTLV